MEKHVYMSHLGDIYLLNDYQEPEICSRCGDCDWYIGTAENMEDVAKLLICHNYGHDEIEEETGYRVVFKKVREVEFK